MIIFHFFFGFIGLIVAIVLLCSLPGMVSGLLKGRESGKAVIAATAFLAVYCFYFWGCISLWDTSDGMWGGLAVVKNGEVVELDRTFVWVHGNGLTTFRWSSPEKPPKEYTANIPKLVEKPSRVTMWIKPMDGLSELDAANREYKFLQRYHRRFEDTLESLIGEAAAGYDTASGKTLEAYLRERAPEKLHLLGYQLLSLNVVELDKKDFPAYYY
jgi:hypothetical protein